MIENAPFNLQSIIFKALRSNALAVIATAFFLCLVTASAYRIVNRYQAPGDFDSGNLGYCDFHNGVYYPSVGFLNRESAYDPDFVNRYPIYRAMPMYSPATFAFHVPWALFPLRAAEVLYFVWTICLVVAIAGFIASMLARLNPDYESTPVSWWTATSLLASFLLASRGGQQTVFTGYFTFELILALLLAVHYSKARPWLSGLCLLVVSAKPTYILPVGVLMFWRQDWKALVIGACLSIVVAVAASFWIEPEGGIAKILEDVQANQETHRAEDWERPSNNWVRVDLLAVVAKWSGWNPAENTQLSWMFAMLIPVSILLAYYQQKLKADGNLFGLTSAVVLLLPQIAVYHQAYDALLVLPIAIAALLSNSKEWNSIGIATRFCIVICCLIPAVNYLSSQSFLERFQVTGVLHQLLTSINSISLCIAAILVLVGMVKNLPNSQRLPE